MARSRAGTLLGVLALGCPGQDAKSGPVGADGTGGSTATVGEGLGEPGRRASLVDVDAWTLDAAPPTELAADAPADVVCEFGWGLEDGVFEVDSALCNWGSFTQPSLVAVAEGDTMEVILLHDALFSEDADAQAHVAVALGETVVWETTLMIPSPAGYLRPRIEIPRDAAAGTPVHLHVHNHGYNNYRLVDIVLQGR